MAEEKEKVIFSFGVAPSSESAHNVLNAADEQIASGVERGEYEPVSNSLGMAWVPPERGSEDGGSIVLKTEDSSNEIPITKEMGNTLAKGTLMIGLMSMLIPGGLEGTIEKKPHLKTYNSYYLLPLNLKNYTSEDVYIPLDGDVYGSDDRYRLISKKYLNSNNVLIIKKSVTTMTKGGRGTFADCPDSDDETPQENEYFYYLVDLDTFNGMKKWMMGHSIYKFDNVVLGGGCSKTKRFDFMYARTWEHGSFLSKEHHDLDVDLLHKRLAQMKEKRKEEKAEKKARKEEKRRRKEEGLEKEKKTYDYSPLPGETFEEQRVRLKKERKEKKIEDNKYQKAYSIAVDKSIFDRVELVDVKDLFDFDSPDFETQFPYESEEETDEDELTEEEKAKREEERKKWEEMREKLEKKEEKRKKKNEKMKKKREKQDEKRKKKREEEDKKWKEEDEKLKKDLSESCKTM